MHFSVADLKGSGKHIVQKIIGAETSQLVIPPKLQKKRVDVDPVPGPQKYIGLFSSGTTGQPKCIWNSSQNLIQNGLYTAKAFDLKPNQRMLMMAAPWHVAGLSWAIMAEELGFDYEFLTTQKGEKESWLREIQRVKPDVLLTVPGVLSAIDDEEWFVPKIIFGGYAPIEGELEKYASHCKVMIQGYGQTEAGGLITAHTMKSNEARFTNERLCCGFPIEGVKVRCEGTAGDPAPIFVHSKTAFTQEEYHTGDLGYKDESGRLFITGRSEGIINEK